MRVCGRRKFADWSLNSDYTSLQFYDVTISDNKDKLWVCFLKENILVKSPIIALFLSVRWEYHQLLPMSQAQS